MKLEVKNIQSYANLTAYNFLLHHLYILSLVIVFFYT